MPQKKNTMPVNNTERGEIPQKKKSQPENNAEGGEIPQENNLHYVMENGENQHTFVRRSEIAFYQRETQYGKVRHRQTNLTNSVFDSVSRFETMFDA